LPKEIITVYFKDADIEIYESFKETANGKISPTAVAAITEYVKKYNVNPINAEKSEIDEKITTQIDLINNSDYWNKIIPTLSEDQLKILESATHSLEIKASKQLHFGGVRN
jgi:hypothetical protein